MNLKYKIPKFNCKYQQLLKSFNLIALKQVFFTVLLKNTAYQDWPLPTSRTTSPGIMKYTILEEAFLLYYHAFKFREEF
jgi:hypothetical protein